MRPEEWSEEEWEKKVACITGTEQAPKDEYGPNGLSSFLENYKKYSVVVCTCVLETGCPSGATSPLFFPLLRRGLWYMLPKPRWSTA